MPTLNNAVPSRPKDVSINRVELVTVNNIHLDLFDFLVELNIYEDLFTNTISGNIVLTDWVNLVNVGPLVGQEKLILNFNTPNVDDSPEDREFIVYKISDRGLKTDKTQVYTLHFSSKETIKNALTKISKSFTGETSAIVRQIVESEYGLASQKVLDTESARGVKKVVIPYWSPLRTINWLAARSVSAEGQDANYVFYENADGFHFKSIGKLMQEKPKSPQPFFFGPGNIRESDTANHTYPNVALDFFRINDYTVSETMDMLDNIQAGAFAAQLTTFDLTTRKMAKYEYDYMKDFKKVRHIEPGFEILSTKENPFGWKYNEFPLSRRYFYDLNFKMFDGTAAENNPHEWLMQRQAQFAHLSMMNITVNLPGDTSRRVGEVVSVVIPSTESFTTDYIEDKYLSGQYIITGLRHKIRKDGHEMILELAKDAVHTQIPEKIQP